MPRKPLPKVKPNGNKEKTAIRQELHLEKFKTEINLQKFALRNIWNALKL